MSWQVPETSSSAADSTSNVSMESPFILTSLLNTVLLLCVQQCMARVCKPSSMNWLMVLFIPAATQLTAVTACNARICSTLRSLPLVWFHGSWVSMSCSPKSLLMSLLARALTDLGAASPAHRTSCPPLLAAAELELAEMVQKGRAVLHPGPADLCGAAGCQPVLLLLREPLP